MNVAPQLVQACHIWYCAERRADPSLPAYSEGLAEGDLIARALPRVVAVFSGEVRWSEASAGDKAIWRGRPRDIESFQGHQGWAVKSSVEWLNLFDTVTLGPRSPQHSHRMFGCANVGNYFWTNLQVPGQLPGGRWFQVDQVYAVPSRMLAPGEEVVLTLNVGWRIAHSALPLREWMLGVPVGKRIPPRECFSVTIDQKGEISTPLIIVVHLEGTTSRETQ